MTKKEEYALWIRVQSDISHLDGFALTRRPEFLEPYKSAIAILPQSLEQLKQLVHDNPSQTQKLQQKDLILY